MNGGFATNPYFMFLAMGALALVPLLVVSCTCYVKLSVVFGLLRLAIGAQQLPSGIVTTALSLMLTLFIMNPVLEEMKGGAWQVIQEAMNNKKTQAPNGEETLRLLGRLAEVSRLPLARFLFSHSDLREREFFSELSKGLPAREDRRRAYGPPETSAALAMDTPEAQNLLVLSAAFLVRELRTAFSFGFLLFLPFLVIDLVIANLLVGLGMTMMSPTTIALPLKIFLLVLTDSWFLIIRSVVSSYG